MMYAIRMMTVERGLDPREFTVLAYGGGGGLFAAATAAELDIPRVVIPRAAANFSAWGILTSDYREDVSATNVRPLTAETMPEVIADLQSLSGAAVAELGGYGFGDDAIATSFRADLRYLHQEHTVTIPIMGDRLGNADQLVAALREAFVEHHRQLYGHGEADAPIELVTLRCRATAAVDVPAPTDWPELGEPVVAGVRQTYFAEKGNRLETPMYPRELLGRGRRVVGPAIVEEWTTTILVPPGWSAAPDRLGNLVLDREGAG
jgi:N-methylhydantoinase A